jgi:hypothetical protein
MKNKRLFITTGIVTLASAVGVGATALADSSTASNASGEPSGLVQKISDTFHLNKSDVQKVFDDWRTQHQQERRQQLAARLDQAVKDGKITEDQKNKILAKLDELHNQLKDNTSSDRRLNHHQLFEELQQWAKDNGINLGQLLPQSTRSGDPAHD